MKTGDEAAAAPSCAGRALAGDAFLKPSGVAVSSNVAATGGVTFPGVEGVRLLAGLDELPGKLVGVHDLRAALAQEAGGGGFAHAHAAGQAANFHGANRRHMPCTAR